MNSASPGPLARLLAGRPFFCILVFAFACAGVVAIAARDGLYGDIGRTIAFLTNALTAVGFPFVLLALAPKKPVLRFVIAGVAIVLLTSLILNNHQGWITFPPGLAPATSVLAISIGLITFLTLVSPMAKNTYSAPGILGAILGAAGASGVIALNGGPADMWPWVGMTLGAVLGTGVGIHVHAEYARFFADGAAADGAASASAHEALSPTAFAIFAVAALFVIVSFPVNFGAVDWRLASVGLVSATLTGLGGLFGSVAGRSAMRVTDADAMDENLRRRRFVAAWRTVRNHIPPSTAYAAVVIFFILAIVALFEGRFKITPGFGALIFALWSISAVAFVSLRTSVLIAALTVISTVGALIVLELAGRPQLSSPQIYIAAVMCSFSVAQLTVRWRDANAHWRNAKDIVEVSLNDGLGRFLATIGAGVAAFALAGAMDLFPGAAEIAIAFITMAAMALFMAPFFMTAMSAKFRI